MLERFDLDKTYQYLLIALAFLMPITVSGANAIIVIIIAMFAMFSSQIYTVKFPSSVNFSVHFFG